MGRGTAGGSAEEPQGPSHKGKPFLTIHRLASSANRSGLSQMRELRSTIPRLQECAGTSKISEAARAAMNEINEYKKLATAPENARILEHAKQSRKDNPQDIKPWRPSDEPNWFDSST